MDVALLRDEGILQVGMAQQHAGVEDPNRHPSTGVAGGARLVGVDERIRLEILGMPGEVQVDTADIGRGREPPQSLRRRPAGHSRHRIPMRRGAKPVSGSSEHTCADGAHDGAHSGQRSRLPGPERNLYERRTVLCDGALHTRAEDGRMSLLGSEEQAESGYDLDRDHMSPWSEVRGRTQFRPEITAGSRKF